MSVQISGDAEIRRRIRELGDKFPDAMAGAVYKLGVVILSEAIRRAPVEFGVLRSSGYASPPQGKGAASNVEIGFGTVYAVPQHERLDYHHPRGGEAKYLERAAQHYAPNALRLLAKWVEELAASGAKFGTYSGVPTHPRVTNSNRKSRSQGARLKRAAANVRKRTGR